MKKHFTRAQKMVVVQGILCFVFILDILQLWLITATMNSYLGGDSGVPVPALIASMIFFALNLGLLKFLYRMDKVPTRANTGELQ